VAGMAAGREAHLFEPRDAYRATWGGGGRQGQIWPDNPPSGATFTYYLPEEPSGELTMDIMDSSGSVLRSYTSVQPEETVAFGAEDRPQGSEEPMLPTSPGSHRFTWDLQNEPLEPPEGAVTSWSFTGGVTVPPGSYTVRMTAGDWTEQHGFRVLKDPRLESVTVADLQTQWRLGGEIRDSLATIYDQIRRLRRVRGQASTTATILEADGVPIAGAVRVMADSIGGALNDIEVELINTNSQSRQDPINFQPRVDHQYAYLYGFVTEPQGEPTDGATARLGDLNVEWSVLRVRLENVMNTLVAEYNAMLRGLNVPPIISDH
jgi:hypothetical protein